MSTRGVIARTTGEGTFKGRYHHWDSYPTGLGATLADLLRFYNGNLKKMLEVLIDQHPAGWSTINGKDFHLPPGFASDDSKQPSCYCHGARSEAGQDVTEKDDVGAEWAYVFDTELEVLHVLRMMVRQDGDEKRVIGMFGYGVEGQYWAEVARIEIDDLRTTNWGEVECGERLERCHHVEGYHESRATRTKRATIQ